MAGFIFDPNVLRPHDPRYHPAPVPPTGAFDFPQQKICANAHWMSHIVGVMERLCWEDAWKGTGEEIQTAIHGIRSIMATSTQSCAPTMCDVYGPEAPSWETIAEDYFACYGVELEMPFQMRVNAECGLEFRQSETGPWTTVPGAQFVQLEDSCVMTGPLRIQNTDTAVTSLDVQAVNGNEGHLGRWRTYSGDGFHINNGGVSYFKNQLGKTYFGTTEGQWRVQATAGSFAIGQNANDIPWLTVDAGSGVTSLLSVLAFNRFITGHGMVTNASIYPIAGGNSNVNRTAKLMFEIGSYSGSRVGMNVENDGVGTRLHFYDSASGPYKQTITGDMQGATGSKAVAAAMAALGLVNDATTLGTVPANTIEMRVDGGYIQWRPSAAAAWINLIALADLEGPQGEPGEDGEDGASPEMRVSGDYIQWRQDDDNPTWTNLVALEDITGPQGEPGAGNENAPLPEPSDTTRCGVATGVTEWATELFDETMTNIQQSVTAGKIFTDMVTDLLDAFPVIGAIIESAVDFAANVAEKDINDLKGQNNLSFQEDLTQQLYCLLDDTGEITTEIIQAWQSYAISSDPRGPLATFVGTAFALMIGGISPNEFKRRAYVYANDDGNCGLFQCGDGSISFAAETLSIAEDAGTDPLIINVVLTLDGGSLQADLTADIVLSGTATQGDDYNISPTSVTFLAGAVDGDVQQIEFQVINDTESEGPETAVLTLSNVVGGVLGAIPAHTVTIIDDEEDIECDPGCTIIMDTYGVDNPYMTPSAQTELGDTGNPRMSYQEFTINLPDRQCVQRVDIVAYNGSNSEGGTLATSAEVFLDGVSIGTTNFSSAGAPTSCLGRVNTVLAPALTPTNEIRVVGSPGVLRTYCIKVYRCT